MNEEEQVKKQLRKNMIFNLITFSIIFCVLGLVIYGQFHSSLYQSADAELKKVSSQMNMPEITLPKRNGMATNTIGQENWNRNPRLIYIERDEKGDIKTNSEVNTRLNSIFQDIPFSNQLNTIYEVKIGEYFYRGINLLSPDGGYTQVLININAEKAMADQFTITLVMALMVSIILILVASYILSRNTLNPIVASWKRQNQFVQDASHELRTPIAIIKAKQEALLEKPDEKIIDHAEDISITLNETQRLTKLIKELMELARNDKKERVIKKEEFNLDNEIKSIISLYQEVAQTDGKTLELDLKYTQEIFADSNLIKELLIILLDNSLKYTEKGDSIEVKTYKKENKCVIEVSDTGIGISKEAQDHIFERFYREEKSRDRQKGGMGLGLSIAYNIVKLHKGSIKLDKTRVKGTKMIVKIPIR